MRQPTLCLDQRELTTSLSRCAYLSLLLPQTGTDLWRSIASPPSKPIFELSGAAARVVGGRKREGVEREGGRWMRRQMYGRRRRWREREIVASARAAAARAPPVRTNSSHLLPSLSLPLLPSLSPSVTTASSWPQRLSLRRRLARAARAARPVPPTTASRAGLVDPGTIRVVAPPCPPRPWRVRQRCGDPASRSAALQRVGGGGDAASAAAVGLAFL